MNLDVKHQDMKLNKFSRNVLAESSIDFCWKHKLWSKPTFRHLSHFTFRSGVTGRAENCRLNKYNIKTIGGALDILHYRGRVTTDFYWEVKVISRNSYIRLRSSI